MLVISSNLLINFFFACSVPPSLSDLISFHSNSDANDDDGDGVEGERISKMELELQLKSTSTCISWE